jgi:hypothetical protein
MSQALILGLVVVAGLACPLHMWWSHRRGRQAACCHPTLTPDGDLEIEALRARQQRLGVLIAEHEATVAGAVTEAHQTAAS